VTFRSVLALLVAVPAVASAQAIVRPTSAVINSGGPGFGSIADTSTAPACRRTSSAA
jgi:sensor domain CHASE-containing protein